MTTFVRNAWYVAAWEEEVEGDARLGRTLLDERLVIYRLEDGGYAILADRCAHRFAPLSRGGRDGDALVCPYHGLEFGPGGECTRNPFSDTTPKNARVASYTATAKHGLIWFWPGDRDRADPAAIPDFGFLEGQAVKRGHSLFAANYELITDNLMDLSHVEFIHQATFHPNGAAFRGTYTVTDGEGAAIWSRWWLPEVNPPPFLDGAAAEGEAVNQHLDMRWHAPATMMLDIRWATGDADRKTDLFQDIAPHIITPETATTSHYFWTCQPSADGEALARAVFEDEDQPMLEAIQRNMGDADFWDLKPVILQADAGGIYARRRLQQMRRAEERGSEGG